MFLPVHHAYAITLNPVHSVRPLRRLVPTRFDSDGKRAELPPVRAGPPPPLVAKESVRMSTRRDIRIILPLSGEAGGQTLCSPRSVLLANVGCDGGRALTAAAAVARERGRRKGEKERERESETRGAATRRRRHHESHEGAPTTESPVPLAAPTCQDRVAR